MLHIVFVSLIPLWSGLVHAQAVDNCVDETAQLEASASDHGITVPKSGASSSLVTDCEAALQQNSQSTALRLNLAKVLIWAGRESSATIHLELLLGSDREDEAVVLAIALCAYARGSQPVIEQTCEWGADYGFDDPYLAYNAAQNSLANNEPDLGLRLMGQASEAGSAEAVTYLNQLCDDFTPGSGANAFASIPPALSSLDPAYVGAIACESAFHSTAEDDSKWADRGFKYAEAMTFFDDYESTADALLALSESKDPATAGGAIDVLDGLCTATAGDPNDPDFGNDGVPDVMLFPDRAQPVCEAAAYVWPDNGRLHYNLARIYSFLGPAEQTYADDALAEALRLNYPLAVSMAAPSAVPFDVRAFNAPDYIQAFYDQNMAPLNKEPLYTLNYALAMNAVFSQDNVLFLGDNARQILLEVDPSLSIKAARKLTNPALFNDAMDKGLSSIFGPLVKIAEIRKQGGTIADEVRGAHGAILDSPMVQINVLKDKAKQDAQRLAILYDTNPADFRKIYAGISMFIEQP